MSERPDQTSGPILVVGATGRFGGEILARLAPSDVPVRALVRKSEDIAGVVAKGAAEAAVGDLYDPQSMADALQGATGLFLLTPAFAPDEAKIGVRLVEQAKAAGVRKIVFSSVLRPIMTELPNHAEKIPIENAIAASQIPFVILNSTMVFQNLPAAMAAAAKTGVLAEPYPANIPVTRVDYRDVAQVATLALTTDRLDFGSFELCDQHSYDRVEVAQMMSEALGRRVDAVEIGFDEWSRKARLVPDSPLANGLRTMFAHYGQHGIVGNSTVLQALLGRAPTSLPDYIAEIAPSLRS